MLKTGNNQLKEKKPSGRAGKAQIHNPSSCEIRFTIMCKVGPNLQYPILTLRPKSLREHHSLWPR